MSGNIQVYQIRPGVFALGTKGRKAVAVCTWSKPHNRYLGIRGRKPTIPTDLGRAKAPSQVLREALRALAN